MAYDENDDEIIREYAVPNQGIQIIHASYKGAPTKFGLRRVIVKKDGQVIYRPIGRMTGVEIRAIHACILADNSLMPPG